MAVCLQLKNSTWIQYMSQTESNIFHPSPTFPISANGTISAEGKLHGSRYLEQCQVYGGHSINYYIKKK